MKKARTCKPRFLFSISLDKDCRLALLNCFRRLTPMSPDTHPIESRSFTALLTVCCLVTFGCYFSVSMRLPVVPLHAIGFGVSTSQIGVINAAFYLMAGLLALPAGTLSDSVPPWKLRGSGTAFCWPAASILFLWPVLPGA
jgi:nitrate/nitrite transporter NarK